MTDEFGRTVILNLVPTSFRLLVNVENDEHEQIVLLGEIKLKRRESVKLSTDEDFQKLEGGLRFVDGGEEIPDRDKPIGWLTYCEKVESIDMYHKASYTVGVKIPTRRFDALLAAVSQGRLPSEISINVAGMTYDWQPDGSGKTWDNKSRAQLPITSITFYVPLIGGDPHHLFDDQTVDDTLPATRAQFKALSEAINYVAGNSKETVICLIIIICFLLVVVWRGW